MIPLLAVLLIVASVPTSEVLREPSAPSRVLGSGT